MVVPERPDAKSLDRALEHMEKLGIKANVASAEDAEIMYLAQAGLHHQGRPRPGVHADDLRSRSARMPAKTERIQTMRAFWEKRLGVSDITKTARL